LPRKRVYMLVNLASRVPNRYSFFTQLTIDEKELVLAIIGDTVLKKYLNCRFTWFLP